MTAPDTKGVASYHCDKAVTTGNYFSHNHGAASAETQQRASFTVNSRLSRIEAVAYRECWTDMLSSYSMWVLLKDTQAPWISWYETHSVTMIRTVKSSTSCTYKYINRLKTSRHRCLPVQIKKLNFNCQQGLLLIIIFNHKVVRISLLFTHTAHFLPHSLSHTCRDEWPSHNQRDAISTATLRTAVRCHCKLPEVVRHRRAGP